MSLHCEKSTYGLTGFIFLLTICIKGTTGRQDITPGVTTTLEPYITASAFCKKYENYVFFFFFSTNTFYLLIMSSNSFL